MCRKKQTHILKFIISYTYNYTSLPNMNTDLKSQTKKFESCFAAGLDLSEFSSSDPKSSQISAAAELLEVKNREILHKQLEDQEEEIMLRNAAQKAKEAEKRSQGASNQIDIIQSGGGGSGFSSNLLIDMHTSDLSGGKKETGKQNKKKKNQKVVAKKSTNYKVKVSNVSQLRGK
jgi:hypothetical protein